MAAFDGVERLAERFRDFKIVFRLHFSIRHKKYF